MVPEDVVSARLELETASGRTYVVRMAPEEARAAYQASKAVHGELGRLSQERLDKAICSMHGRGISIRDIAVQMYMSEASVRSAIGRVRSGRYGGGADEEERQV